MVLLPSFFPWLKCLQIFSDFVEGLAGDLTILEGVVETRFIAVLRQMESELHDHGVVVGGYQVNGHNVVRIDDDRSVVKPLKAPPLFRIRKIVGDNHRRRENGKGSGNSYKDVKKRDRYVHDISQVVINEV